MKVILVSFLLFGLALADLTCECGKRNAGRSVGGKETKKNEYPWVVALQKVYSASTFCGGTIITPWHVITAVHCLFGVQAWELLLVVGATNIDDYVDSTRQEVFVDEIIRHPYFDIVTGTADVAILETASEMLFNEYVGPACMPNIKMEDELVDQMVKIVGWGTDDYINQPMMAKLMQLDLKVTAVSTCEGGYGKKLCTFSFGKDPCRGDSGGPVVWLDPDTNRFTLVGVVSHGPTECGLTLKPSVQTNLSFYSRWVKMRISYTKRGSAKTCQKV